MISKDKLLTRWKRRRQRQKSFCTTEVQISPIPSVIQEAIMEGLSNKMKKATPMYCGWCGQPLVNHSQKCEGPPEIDFEELDGDDSYTITELLEVLKKAKDKYGAGSKVRFDAGHNNVLVKISPLIWVTDFKR